MATRRRTRKEESLFVPQTETGGEVVEAPKLFRFDQSVTWMERARARASQRARERLSLI